MAQSPISDSAAENPFPRTAAARLGGFTGEFQVGMGEEPPPETVRTHELAELERYVDAYLNHTGRPAVRGRAISVIGRLGVGKTHVTREIVQRLHDWPGNPETGSRRPPIWIIDDTVRDLGAYYREHLLNARDAQEPLREFQGLVNDYLSDVTAARLEGTAERREIVEGLRDRRVDPEKAAKAFYVDEALIHEDLRQHLSDLTEHRKFATALSLLIDPHFAEAVWNWLRGGPPHQVLIDRGITEQIDSVDQVMDTLGVFAFLYGRSGQPYVLVMDSVENTLAWPETERISFGNAFNRLVNVFTNLGGLLIFDATPEPLRTFSPGLRDRIVQIWPNGLNPAQTAELIDGYLDRSRTAGHAEPVSFERLAVAELQQLFDGNPRQMLRVCNQAWADAESGPIAVSNVHQAVRAVHEQAGAAQILNEIVQIAVRRQWRTSPGDQSTGIQLWIRTGAHSAIAVVITDSILSQQDLDVLNTAAGATPWRVADDERELRRILVVVNGYLSGAMRDKIVARTDTQPIVYDVATFTERLPGAVHELQAGLQAAAQEAAAEAQSSRLDRVLDLAERTRQRLDEIQGGTTGPGTPRPRTEHVLPDALRDAFVAAQRALTDLSTAPDGLLREAGLDTARRPTPQRIDVSPDQLRQFGVHTFATELLRTFEAGVAAWLQESREVGLTGEQERRLFVVCRSYELTTEVLPLADPEGPVETMGTGDGSRHSASAHVLTQFAEKVRRLATEAVQTAEA